jgi:hypothetical protein
VQPNGAGVTYRFEYGTTTAYGAVTPSRSLSQTSGSVAVSAAVSSLRRNTTYHFRLVAIDASAAPHAGAGVTFRTTK